MDSVTVLVSNANPPIRPDFNDLSNAGGRLERRAPGFSKRTTVPRCRMSMFAGGTRRDGQRSHRVLLKPNAKEFNYKSRVRNRSATLTLTKRWMPLIIKNDGEFFVKINSAKSTGQRCLGSDFESRRFLDVLDCDSTGVHCRRSEQQQNTTSHAQTCSHAVQSDSFLPQTNRRSTDRLLKKPYFEVVSTRPLTYRISASDRHRLFRSSELQDLSSDADMVQEIGGPKSHRHRTMELFLQPAQPAKSVNTGKSRTKTRPLVRYAKAERKQMSFESMNNLQTFFDNSRSIRIPSQVIGVSHLVDYQFYICTSISRLSSEVHSVSAMDRHRHLTLHNIPLENDCLDFQRHKELCIHGTHPVLHLVAHLPLVACKFVIIIHVDLMEHTTFNQENNIQRRLHAFTSSQDEWLQGIVLEQYPAFALALYDSYIRQVQDSLLKYTEKPSFHTATNCSTATWDLNEAFTKDALGLSGANRSSPSATPSIPQRTLCNVNVIESQNYCVNFVQLHCANQISDFTQVDLSNCEISLVLNTADPNHRSDSPSHSVTSSVPISLTERSHHGADSWKEFGSSPLYFVDGDDEYELPNSQLKNVVNNYVEGESINRELTPESVIDIEPLVGIRSAPSRLQTTPQSPSQPVSVQSLSGGRDQ